jgi:hypothetical protein
MKKLVMLAAGVALAAGVGGMLKADDSTPPTGAGGTVDVHNAYLWGVEHTALIDKDADASGVRAVIDAGESLKSQPPQVQLDFFNKALYETKNRAVQRQIRFELYRLYSGQGQNDKAMDQLEQLMIDE